MQNILGRKIWSMQHYTEQRTTLHNALRTSNKCTKPLSNEWTNEIWGNSYLFLRPFCRTSFDSKLKVEKLDWNFRGLARSQKTEFDWCSTVCAISRALRFVFSCRIVLSKDVVSSAETGGADGNFHFKAIIN